MSLTEATLFVQMRVSCNNAIGGETWTRSYSCILQT